MRNNTQKIAFKPRENMVLSDAVELAMYRCNMASANSFSQQRTINGRVSAKPTVLTSGTALIPIAGQWINITGCSIAGYNGSHKVLWVDSANKKVAIDFDSTALASPTDGEMDMNLMHAEGGVLADQALAGGTDTAFATAGQIVPDSTSGSYLEFSDAASLDFLRLSTLIGAGGMVLFFDVEHTGTPSAEEVLMAWGREFNGTNGYLAVRLTTTPRHCAIYRPPGAGSDTALLSTTTHAAARWKIAYHIDGYAMAIQRYDNGDAKTISAITGLPTVPIGTDKVSILSGIAGANTLPHKHAGSNASGLIVRNISIIRYTGDKASKVPQLVRELCNNPDEKPLILRNF